MLGINRVPTLRASSRCPILYSRLRDIEAPMLAACYLTEFTEGLAQLYDLGTEIETYRDATELCAKLKQLESDPHKRRAMRTGAQRRALREHTVASTLNKIACALSV